MTLKSRSRSATCTSSRRWRNKEAVLNKLRYTAFTLGYFLLLPYAVAEVTAPASCTTNDRTYYPTSTTLPSNLSYEQTRDAVLVALGYADVDVSWARDTFAGQWFFEYEDADAIYAGYSVRSHYLRTAILIGDTTITTIVCDSRNLKQTERKIHRKVPGWKGTLDDNIRIALGQASEYFRKNADTQENFDLANKLENLESLRRSGVLTNEEYETLRRRVIDSY